MEDHKSFLLECTQHGIDPSDPDLGSIKEGHICKHKIRWPHECKECDEQSWKLHQLNIKYNK